MRLVIDGLARPLATILAVMTVLFVVLRVLPGDPAALLMGDYAVSAAEEQALRESLGLGRPIHEQYAIYLADLARGDLGYSYRSRAPVAREVIPAIWPSVVLVAAAVVVALTVGVALGVLAAVHRNSALDAGATAATAALLAAPNFWFAILLVYFLAYGLGWFPIFGMASGRGLLAELNALVLPALALGLRHAALVARITRSAVLEELRQEYVRTARAKGLGGVSVMARHIMPNVAFQVMTVVGTEVGVLLGGAVVIEAVFARPGLGKLLLDAMLDRDYPTVQAVVIAFSVWVVLVNRAIDAIYPLIDPRLRAV